MYPLAMVFVLLGLICVLLGGYFLWEKINRPEAYLKGSAGVIAYAPLCWLAATLVYTIDPSCWWQHYIPK